jgi:hypothetical protein
VLGKVKTQAEERPRTHLMNRHKISDRGTALLRFPRQKLYANYGLYNVPMTTGWTWRMPRCEDHRKAVCGQIACTV